MSKISNVIREALPSDVLDTPAYGEYVADVVEAVEEWAAKVARELRTVAADNHFPTAVLDDLFIEVGLEPEPEPEPDIDEVAPVDSGSVDGSVESRLARLETLAERFLARFGG